MFKFVEPEGLRSQSVMGTIVVHAALLSGALLLPLFLIEPLRTPKYDMTLLAPAEPRRVVETPHLTAPPVPKPKPIVVPPPKLDPVVPVPVALPTPVPKVVEVKPVPEFKAPEIHVEPKPAPVVTEKPRFDSLLAEEVKPTPRPVVQTGGFGDTNGSAAKSLEKPMNVARLGAFDSSAGEGTGKGSTRGVVSTAGFESAGSTTATKAKAGQVASASVFETPQVAASQSPQKTVKSVDVPVEIISKPRPEYSEDGRKMRIEGEVALRVLFAATGRVRVLGLVKGLGYGLDEKASQAAEKIQFKPAASDGIPVDSTAIVRIAFQLAN